VRVLSVGNMYPPHHLGGYELVWRSAVQHLRETGHDTRVLTSDLRLPGVGAADDADVHRELRWYWREHRFPWLWPPARVGLERHNAAVLRAHLDRFGPDAIAWWSMGGMSLSLIGQAARAGVPAAAFVHDDWLLYGPRVDQWTRLAGRRALAGVAGRITGVPPGFDPAGVAAWRFVSESTRRRALQRLPGLRDHDVSHSGIERRFLAPAPSRPWDWRLLYAGRVDARKGIDTAIDALAQLPDGATLAVVGGGDEQHLGELRSRAGARGLDGRVDFSPTVDRDAVAAAYAAADVVVFPVTWEEPWGLVPLEAMGRARPVVATGRGGSGEYLRDRVNCLLFDAGDPAALAARLRELADDRGLRERLVEGGLATARAHTEDEFNAGVVATLERVATSG
jgi:glycogen synthase